LAERLDHEAASAEGQSDPSSPQPSTVDGGLRAPGAMMAQKAVREPMP
jgi:hypothetical protein